MVLGILGFGVSFVVSLLLYPHFIEFLKTNDISQKPSEYALDEYKDKEQTVTFGGLLFVIIPILVTLVLLIFKPSALTLLVMVMFLLYGIIGLVDDYLIIKMKNNDGLKPSHKFLLQIGISILFYFLYIQLGGNTQLKIPFVPNPIELSWLYLPFVMIMLSGASNGVNLTDGMDGLATGTVMIALVPFMIFSYLTNKTALLIFILSLIGSLGAFLVYNRKPAKIFMGDVGSLPLGALLAMLAIVLNKELLLIIIGGVFVFETLTVIIQKISWKLRKKRVFKYTPIHYTFILNGWKEKDVVLFFYGLGLACMIIGLGMSAIA